jgi:hypothetical protein
MENNNNSNDNNYKKHTKTKSMKMQDFFGITNLDLIKSKSEQIKIKEKTPEENESDENEEALGSYNNNNNNNNLYEYLYDSAMEAEEPSLYQSTDRIKIKENIISEKINEINNQSKKDNIQEKKIIIQEQIYPIESINIFIDDIKTEYADFVIQNYQCKFIFDDKVLAKFVNLVHFTPKYFEFPLFYAYKGSYDEVTNITTITLKDYRSYKISSKNKSIYKQLFDKNQNKVDFYKYAYFYKDVQDKKNIKYEIDGWDIYKPSSEYKRQGIEFSDTKFCFSNLNSKYELCETYPNILVIPKKFDNKELFNIAKSRMKNRFPILSYCYHYESSSGKKKIKSYMYRSAQIKKSGIIFKSKNLEVEYMNEITNIEKNNQGFIIFDCRSEFAAKANTFKGAGSEDPKHYKNCIKLIFGAIENIHSIRKSLKNALQKAYYGNENIIEGKISFSIKNNNEKNFLSKFESTKWLEYLSALLIGSICVAKKLYQNINVLVHCSDGWDRTAQVCSLVQIILDPYFRTIEGFAVLVEKEWVSFGHKFAMRNGCDVRKEKKKDRSPIFIQFIHAVQQMTMQYPTAFEYNNNFLLFLCDEIYSNKYGTFLFNCEKDKFNNNQEKKTISIWSDIFYEKNKYINDIYKPINGTINVKGELKYLNIWNDFFFKYDKVGMAYKNRALLDKQEYVAKILEEKNKSILELLNVIKSNGLENLVKDNKIYNLYKDKLDKSE